MQRRTSRVLFLQIGGKLVRLMPDIYCMACAQIIPGDQAPLVFKTGYYKIHYPLGLCAECEASRSRELDAQTRMIAEGKYDMSPPFSVTESS